MPPGQLIPAQWGDERIGPRWIDTTPENKDIGLAMSQSIPSELSAFLTRHIDSIAQLEALLLTRRSADMAWSAESAAGRLYVSEREAGDTLAHLAACGLLARQGAEYTYSPQSPELARIVDVLEQHYKRQLIPITNLIHAKPRRVRQFADAFKLKKE